MRASLSCRVVRVRVRASVCGWSPFGHAEESALPGRQPYVGARLRRSALARDGAFPVTLRSLIGNAPSRTSALPQVRRWQAQVHRSRGSRAACASRPLVRPLGRSGQRASSAGGRRWQSVGASGFGVLEMHPLERCKTPTCSASACSNQRRAGLGAPTHQKPAARRSALAR